MPPQATLADAAAATVRLEQIERELEIRKQDALRRYRPYNDMQQSFHESLASERAIRGGNQTGKTVACSAEMASAATGWPIIGLDGKPIADKFAESRHQPLIIWLIGRGEKHIGQTFHRALFEPGMFDILRDHATGEWVIYRPDNPEHVARRHERKPSRPFIPKRLIKSISWIKEVSKTFEMVELINGTKIYAFTSNAYPKEGDPVDLIWIDENIAKPHYVAEWQARLMRRKGRLIWSAFPQMANPALLEMLERAEEDKRNNVVPPDVEEFRLTLSGNPFVDEDEKRKRRKGWSESERLARDEGIAATDTVLMFPTFHYQVHQVMLGWRPGMKVVEDRIDTRRWTALDWAIYNAGGVPPIDWTRYMALDPGHTRGALLCVAVPPPQFGDYVVAYDELYPEHFGAKEFADAFKPMTLGCMFQAFLIDMRAGRQTGVSRSAGETNYRDFCDAFGVENIGSVETGTGFRAGLDEPTTRATRIREWLAIREDGTPKFKYIAHTTRMMQREFALYKKTIVREEVLDKPVAKHDHLMFCLGALACTKPGLRFVPLTSLPREQDPAVLQFQEFMRRRNGGQKETACELGPSLVSA